MDSTDVRILVQMAYLESDYVAYSGRRISSAEIGKTLGLDEKTVRARITRMETSGFIKYYQASPNLALFGLRSMGSYRFESLNLSTKFAMVEKMPHVPKLVQAFDFLGPYVSADIAGASSTEVEEGAQELAKFYELTKKALGGRVVREPLQRLDRLDWQLIQKLRYDARLDTKEIASGLSVTPRMVGYRVSRILSSGAVSIRAIIDPRKQEGLVFYELEVAIEGSRQAEVLGSLRGKFGDRLWSMRNPSPNMIIFGLFGFALGEPEYSVMNELKTEGVRRCSLYVLKEVIEPSRPSWLDELIESKIVG